MSSPARSSSDHEAVSLQPWMGWTAAALAASLWHTFIDAQIGLLGPTSDVMFLAQGLALLASAALVGWWVYVGFGAVRGSAVHLGALTLLTFIQPVLFDGAVAFLVAPPPADAFPYQDLSHLSSLALGVGALVSLRRSVGWGRWGRPSWVALGLKVAASGLGSYVFFTRAAG